jgi:sugar-specific transcriptional regulator TrmB
MTINYMKELLKKIGLTGNEATIYLNLLELGSVTTKDIIFKTNLSRGQVYDCLGSLATKGLVSNVIMSNTKYFEAFAPTRLKKVIERKKEELETQEKELDKIIPALEKKRKLSKEDQEVFHYKGPRGLKTLFEDALNTKGTLHIIGGFAEDAKTIKEFIPTVLAEFHRRRIQRGLKAKMIFPKGSIERAFQVKDLPNTEVRILPADFASVAGLQIRDDKIDFVLWTSQPIGTTIRSQEIANYHKQYFDFLWKQAKPLK